MKINYAWNEHYSTDEVGILLHPDNKFLVSKLEGSLKNQKQLTVINPRNNRKCKLNFTEIRMFEAMDELSKVYTIQNEIYFVKGRLKELAKYQNYGLLRINNSVILNLQQVESFKNGRYARLEVQTKDQQIFIVSRHYAKQIRGKLR